MEKGKERGRGRTLGRRGRGAVTPAGCTEGALHGEACRMFFFVCFFIALSKKRGGFYSSGMAYAADRSQLLSKTHNVFAPQSEGSIMGLRLTSPAQPETEQTCISFSEIFQKRQRHAQRPPPTSTTQGFFILKHALTHEDKCYARSFVPHPKGCF